MHCGFLTTMMDSIALRYKPRTAIIAQNAQISFNNGDADRRTEDGIEVHRAASTITPNPSLRTDRNLADTCDRFGIVTTGLRECRVGPT